MKKICALVTVVSFLVLQGCSAFRDTTQTVTISCAEPETIIVIDGQYKNCPLKVEAKRDRSLYIQAHKPGYNTYGRSIGYHMNATGVLDFVGGLVLLVPVIGILTPGAWDLDETNITVQLLQNNAISIPAALQAAPDKPDHR